MPYEDRGNEDKAIIIVAALIEQEGKLLMVQESKEDVYGKWNVPAGHILFGENPYKAVRREVKEETGYEVEPYALGRIFSFKEKSGFPILRFNIYCKLIGGSEAERESEILAVNWFSKEELEQMKLREELRSERTWMSLEDWFEGTKFPLETINVLEEKF